jgi:hypothetical protein
MAMTAERWARIGELFHQALERSTGERDALLADSCAGDADLRASVEALLLAHRTGLPLIDDGLAALVSVLETDADSTGGQRVEAVRDGGAAGARRRPRGPPDGA